VITIIEFTVKNTQKATKKNNDLRFSLGKTDKSMPLDLDQDVREKIIIARDRDDMWLLRVLHP